MRPPPVTALAHRDLPAAPDPLVAFEAVRGLGSPWLLDSALRNSRLGRFSFLGADPWLVLRARGRRLELECRRRVVDGLQPGHHVLQADPLETLRTLLPRLVPDASAAELPFVGGVVGYLGHELVDLFEALGPPVGFDPGLPDAVLLFVDRLLAWDHQRDRALAVGLGSGADPAAARNAAEANARAAEGWLAAPQPVSHRRAVGARGPACPPFDEASYGKAVSAVLEEIEEGRVYQACLTHRIERSFEGDPWDLYRALRRLNPAPFAAYLELPELALVGSSPERFLRVSPEGQVESRPIKGTRPRGRHAGEDRALRDALESSAKDRAENLMIVDLVRNDLGRVCATGSVHVPELMAIEDYAAVFQMVSTVSGQLRPGCDALDLVRAAFPPGSMTGAPKIAAMRLLRRLETTRRGPYAGALGYFDARGGADLSVVIRTLVVQAGRAAIHTGGGVVADSQGGSEWRESLDKARPLLAALDEVAGRAATGAGSRTRSAGSLRHSPGAPGAASASPSAPGSGRGR